MANKVLIISGLPGSGKSRYTKWLEARGWGRLSLDEVGTSDQAFNDAFNGNDALLMDRASKYSGFVIEWGFAPDNLPQVASMIARGYVGWYFDGDQHAAFTGWKQAHPNVEERLWHEQVARLDAAQQDIVSLYGSNILKTVMPGPTYLPEEKISDTLGLIV